MLTPQGNKLVLHRAPGCLQGYPDEYQFETFIAKMRLMRNTMMTAVMIMMGYDDNDSEQTEK